MEYVSVILFGYVTGFLLGYFAGRKEKKREMNKKMKKNRKPFIIDGKVIGYTDDSDFITITDGDVIKETMQDIK